MIEKILIENLAVFEKLEIDTRAPINVFIGENGTGKTQILKFMLQVLDPKQLSRSRTSERHQYMVPEFNSTISDLIREKNDSDVKEGSIILCTNEKEFEFHCEVTAYGNEMYTPDFEGKFKHCFIPAKDILTHAKGFPEHVEKYALEFDTTYIKIIKDSRLPKLRETPRIAKKLLPSLEGLMGGNVVYENEKFYIKKPNGSLRSFDLEAEGLKKIALLWLLLMNETITEGSILLWDEPEANLNPKLSSVIADVLLELSRNGVQIFLSTHSYFLAKYFDILEKDRREVVFHSLYREDDNWESPIHCETSDTFSMLCRNSILEEIIELFEREMEWE